MPSISGHKVYGNRLDAGGQRLVLRTEGTSGYVDVVFAGIVAKHTNCALPGAELLSIEEVGLEEFTAAFWSTKPSPSMSPDEDHVVPKWSSAAAVQIFKLFRAPHTRGYVIRSSSGKVGGVLAESMEYVERAEKWSRT